MHNPFFSPQAEPAMLRLPKCNLHTHLEGSIRPSTLWELAQEQGIFLEAGQDDVASLLQVNGEERSLVDYLAKIAYTYPVLKNTEALQRTAFEAAEDAARDGVIYFELRAGPITHATNGLTIEMIIQAMLDGLRLAEQKYPITCRLIICALRNHAPVLNTRLAAAALDFRSQGVVGFDLAGDESFPAELHAEAFHIARQGGLGITVHAGEAGGSENVRYAIESLHATRIGHGIHSIENPAVLELLRKQKVLLEICPTSNVHTNTVASISKHPVRQFYGFEIPVTIGDDDPITSRTRVSNELTLLQQHFGFTMSEIRHIQQMSVEASFLMDTAVKTRIQTVVEKIPV